MFSSLKDELRAVIDRDPAAGGMLSVLLLYPSVHVMLAYRLAHRLWRWRLKVLSRAIMQLARLLTGIEIIPGPKSAAVSLLIMAWVSLLVRLPRSAMT